MDLYRNLFRSALFRLDPETAHHYTVALAGAAMPIMSQLAGPAPKNAELRTKLANTLLNNPVGLAAGFDKNGQLLELPAALGFGFAEIGSITGRPSKGNPLPRLFRLPSDEAVINRMGLNGDGAEVVAARLKSARFKIPTGINIAKTNDPSVIGDLAIEDQIGAFKQIRSLPLVYVAINASCPNTHEGCLQAKDELATLLTEVQKANENDLPIFLKLSPDSTEQLLDDFVGIASDCELSGFICGNTTVSRENLRTDAGIVKDIGNGGLSGKPLKGRALNLVRNVNRRKKREQQIIGCGGISSASDAMQFIEAGATAVQLYTALVYEGPSVVNNINRELARMLGTIRTTKLSNA